MTHQCEYPECQREADYKVTQIYEIRDMGTEREADGPTHHYCKEHVQDELNLKISEGESNV